MVNGFLFHHCDPASTSPGSLVAIEQFNRYIDQSDSELEQLERSDLVSIAGLHKLRFFIDSFRPKRAHQYIATSHGTCEQHDLLLAGGRKQFERDKRLVYANVELHDTNSLALHACTRISRQRYNRGGNFDNPFLESHHRGAVLRSSSFH